jgi:hypothetical protein
MSIVRRYRSLFTVALSLTLGTQVAFAAGAEDVAAAEALFVEGRTLLERKDYAEACPKLEESYRLDPATGALYALALCHEGQGKLATAWVEFMGVASRANAEQYAEREQSARARAAAIEPRLSFMIVRVAEKTAQLPGLVISRNGGVLRPAAWETSMPLDPGEYVLTATAPGRKAWTTTVAINDQPRREIVQIPELEPELARPAAPARSSSRSSEGAAGAGSSENLSPLRITGIALGGAGAMGLGLALAASLRAIDKNADSAADCQENRCGIAGDRDRMAAREAADLASLSAIAGGVLLGAGAVLFVVGEAPPEAPRSGVALRLMPASVALHASF